MNEEVRPEHYTGTDLECIDVMELCFGKSAALDFCLGCVFKYLWRQHRKGGLEDVNKAKTYISIIERKGWISTGVDMAKLEGLKDILKSQEEKYAGEET